MLTDTFSSRLIAWQKQHGRHDLPWQNTTDPYAIWVSEIMLQQTQVGAVIGYYAKFMARFPSIAALASASEEEVLQYWSGLGYYSRARNLRKAAIAIMQEHGGVFPQDFIAIQALSGIGRSTAAAIASFAFNQRQTILDGNVKRVLARHFAVVGWTSQPKIETELWALAERLLPASNMVAYTQGLMDLGATLCTRSKPQCERCPLLSTCGAYAQNIVKSLPTPKPRKAIPEKYTVMLIVQRGDKVMLEKRPSPGIWGGLWSFPEVEKSEHLTLIANADLAIALGQYTQSKASDIKKLAMFSHTFTHYKLHIQPVLITLPQNAEMFEQPRKHTWLTVFDALNAAIPTPVKKLLEGFTAQHLGNERALTLDF